MADADKGSDRISGGDAQSIRIPGAVPYKALQGAPWWVHAGFLFISMVGIPGTLVAFREFKDWKMEDRRLAVEQQRIEQQAKTNEILSDLKIYLIQRNGGNPR